MADSRRLQILNALRGRLEAIRQANGYATDAGLRVTHGRPHVTPDDAFERVTIVPGRMEIQVDATRAQLRLPVTLEALAVADADSPLDAVEPLLADMKRAVFEAPAQLGGLVADVAYVSEETFDRMDGGKFAGVTLEIALVYHELLATPEH